MPKVSIVVPAFNVAPFLHECLDSILAQTEGDFEVVCIDDGSTDGTPQILAEYALRDGRLGWVSQDNRGLSESRNRGIDLSSGKYLLFCDADDRLKPDAVRSLVEKAERDRLDVLFYGAETVFDDDELAKTKAHWKNRFVYSRDFSAPRSGRALFLALERCGEYRVPVPFQLLRRKHLEDHGIRFFPRILHEDDLFTFQSLLSAKRAARVNDLHYVRRVRAGSIMTSAPAAESAAGYAVCVREMFRFVREHPETAPDPASFASVVRRTAGACSKALAGLPPAESVGADLSWIGTLCDALALEEKRIRALKTRERRLSAEAAALRRSFSFRLGWFLLAAPRAVFGRFAKRGS
jgi:glycosyltransferase involved in cell wall biosynthesis